MPLTARVNPQNIANDDIGHTNAFRLKLLESLHMDTQALD
jgi:hypothetical protein